jgi:hypothetical protein
VWAIGYLLSLSYLLPSEITKKAEILIEKIKPGLISIYSTRAMAFAIKGLCYYQSKNKLFDNLFLIETFADRLVQMYKHESAEKWEWFEGSLTYANSIMPEALLDAWKLTGNAGYKDIAVTSFDFLLSQIFNENGIEVISNKKWKLKGEEAGSYGEQPIDVAYTIISLSKFFDELQLVEYRTKMEIAFNWFLGKNRLNQIIYNPCTGGCYDGLEEFNINLNQGAESTVSYLMARLTVQKYEKTIASEQA